MHTTENNGLAKITLLVFSVTLLLSAALMFAVQPMVGKMLLPIVGGTPAGWIVAMAFFQLMLLVGYLLAHLLSKLHALKHGVFYVLCLIIGVCFLPLSLSAHLDRIPGNPAAHDIFVLLTFAVAVPFIALSATSSTIQRLFTATDHASANDPYFLYAASNFGSFTGLLFYPLIVEPMFAISEQTAFLKYFYIGLTGLAALCIFLSYTGTKKNAKAPAKPAATTQPTAPAVSKKRYLQWLFMSFVPSSLLLGVTIYITTDVISVPMIWVLPLALYLLTFIIAFSKKQIVSQQLLDNIHPHIVLVSMVCISLLVSDWLTGWFGVIFYLGVFTAVTLAYHMRLASLRPLEENSKDLTGFYLMMSVGGALGGVLNAFIIPLVTNRLVEFPLMLLVSLLAHPAIKLRSAPGLFLVTCIVIGTAMLNTTPPSLPFNVNDTLGMVLPLILLLAILSPIFPKLFVLLKPESLMIAASIIFIYAQFSSSTLNQMLMTRNFYGTVRVFEMETPLGSDESGETKYQVRYMTHGTTVHGQQVMDPEFEKTPTAYFSRPGPLGDIFTRTDIKKIAVIGLGVGSMNCYEAPDREFTFVEIDPAVIDVAKDHFTFLSACQSAKEPRILLGDGRLELEKLVGEKFDLIALDAFSSDMVPTHLLSAEAIKLYKEHLSDNGLLIFNISNRYILLHDILVAAAEETGLAHRFKQDLTLNKPFTYPSRWFVMAKSEDILKSLDDKGWIAIDRRPEVRPWTDDYSNIMSVVKF
jgi:spermidine synthase